jgi:DNA-binding transcriptional ArsR family regulator
MVEYVLQLDSIFHSLADPIRRDILRRLTDIELSVGELAQKYDVSLAAISKHLKVLERAKLVRKRKEGRIYMVALVPETLQEADEYLRQYERMWESRYKKLDTILKEEM